MKTQLFKSLPIAIAALIIGTNVKSQESMSPTKPMFKTWSIGVNAGLLSPFSPFGGKEDYSNSLGGLGYGLYLKKQVTPYFSFR